MNNGSFLGCDRPESIAYVKLCLKKIYFQGFTSFKDLRSGILDHIPNCPGVYLVIRNPQRLPEFLEIGSGGQFENKNPNVSKRTLHAKWVKGAFVVYVGNTNRTLRERIGELADFSDGKPAPHRGGRYLWQLKNSEYMRVCWKETAKGQSVSEKSDILREFQRHYGKLPFANLKR